MPQSLAKIWTHLIFSTKDRYPFLFEPNLRKDMHAYLASVLKANTCPTLIVGGVSDHIHALFVLSKNHSIADIVYEVKRSSSKWAKTQGPALKKFHWQSGYGAFSVSESHVDVVKRYIQKQEQHHRRRTFEEEFREFLKRYKIDYDERYVWD
ncbi:MAG: IS200/IS605 family transposase [Acidobacteriota bacterium]